MSGGSGSMEVAAPSVSLPANPPRTTATQYEDSYRAHRLGNWEVSKWYPQERPRARRGHTKIIADDRGHLLPGVARLAPWGHFKATWQLPRRITRKLAKELGSAGKKQQSSWEKRSSHHPLPEQESSTPPLPPPTKKEKKQLSSKERIPIVEEKTVQDSQVANDEHDYTNPVGHNWTPKVIDTAKRVREDLEGYSKTCRIHPEKKNLLEKLVTENGEKPTPTNAREDKSDNESLKSDDQNSMKSKGSSKSNSIESQGSKKSLKPESIENRGSAGSRKSASSSSSKKSKPLEADFISAQFAKELAQNNLKHRPLPDAVEDKLYRALQMKQIKHPGAELENLPTASAVGHKAYVSPGPTQCSKLKVYRPKTAAPKALQLNGEDERPKTCKPKDLNEIDLAICWDLRPTRPEEEPKRPVHIDGSNGSVAPGIFTIVKPRDQEEVCKTPSPNTSKTHGKHKLKTAWPEITENSKPVNPSAVMDIINNNADEGIKKITESSPRRNSGNNRHSCQLVPIKSSDENKNPNSPSSSDSRKSRKGGSSSGIDNNTINTSVNSEKLEKQKLSPKARSSPNLSPAGEEKSSKDKLFYSRPCMACETKTPLEFASKHNKPEYKMAFKAGVPNTRTNSNSGSQASSQTKPLNIPKPKTPFARKSYSINTLAPPFSLWPGTTGMDYPEHWRLSSVYQQSYKPVDLRKNPMIKGIFR